MNRKTSATTRSFRKVSGGMTRNRPAFSLKTRGFRKAGGETVGSLRVVMPPGLLKLMGWRAGLRLKVQPVKDGLRLTPRQIPSVYGRTIPSKRAAAEQVRFSRRWERELRSWSRKRNRKQFG
jgi:hypothetical protein